MRSKPQNAYLYKTVLSPRLLRFQTSKRLCSICSDAEMKSEDYSMELRFLKRIISADDVVSEAF